MAGCIRSSRQRMLYYRIARFDTIKREIKKMLHHIALFRMENLLLGRSRRGVGAGVGVDIFRPELESLKIRRLRSPERDSVDRADGRRTRCRPVAAIELTRA